MSMAEAFGRLPIGSRKSDDAMEVNRHIQGNGLYGSVVSVMALGLMVAGSLEATGQPRVMNDAEMDEVCAKGTAGIDISMASVQEMVFQFQRHTSFGTVTGAGTIRTEFLPSASQASQALHAMAASASPLANVTGLEPLQFQVVGATVRMIGDVNIAVDAAPRALRALENRLVLPGGLTSPNSALYPLGASIGN
jgi:hypothetical protein